MTVVAECEGRLRFELVRRSEYPRRAPTRLALFRMEAA
jgi:hypothetical protein